MASNSSSKPLFAGFGYHSSEEEYVELDSIAPRLYLMTRLIMDASR